MATEEEILNKLSGFSGSENFYKEPLSGCVYTDGFQEFMEVCKCAWLFTDSAIYMMHDVTFKREDFVTIKIKVNEDKSALVKFEDGNYNSLYEKKYGYTDFPLQEYEFFACRNEFGSYTFMLKSEY